MPELIAEVLAGLLLRRVTVTDLGMTPSVIGAEVGLRLSGEWEPSKLTGKLSPFDYFW